MSANNFASDLLHDAPFRFAKTMPNIPHEYTRRKDWPSESSFEWVVRFIRENGVQEKFGRKTFTYLYANGFKYWTMGSPVDRTILINRAKVNEQRDDTSM